jgi:hypothetical protein
VTLARIDSACHFSLVEGAKNHRDRHSEAEMNIATNRRPHGHSSYCDASYSSSSPQSTASTRPIFRLAMSAGSQYVWTYERQETEIIGESQAMWPQRRRFGEYLSTPCTHRR